MPICSNLAKNKLIKYQRQLCSNVYNISVLGLQTILCIMRLFICSNCIFPPAIDDHQKSSINIG